MWNKFSKRILKLLQPGMQTFLKLPFKPSFKPPSSPSWSLLEACISTTRTEGRHEFLRVKDWHFWSTYSRLESSRWVNDLNTGFALTGKLPKSGVFKNHLRPAKISWESLELGHHREGVLLTSSGESVAVHTIDHVASMRSYWLFKENNSIFKRSMRNRMRSW